MQCAKRFDFVASKRFTMIELIASMYETLTIDWNALVHSYSKHESFCGPVVVRYEARSTVR
jgi:hypothetical protein